LLEGRRILVLDDEESLRSLLSEGLTARGLFVDCAGTLEEALDILTQHPPDAVLCDLNLSQDGGHLSGKAASERLLAATGNRKPPLIYMTGELVEAPSGAGDPGKPRFLQKPFRISDVVGVLEKVFAANPPGSQLE
jgi:CheY-like chemotaxis protein